MLRITKSRSAGAAEDYFRKALKSADYYLEGRESLGTWHGLGAARLGLTGEVHDRDFVSLLRNRQPDGEKLTARDKSDRIPMIDFTFNAPKSVSVLWAATQDERFIQAHNNAVNAAMGEIERNMETRVRKGRNAQSENNRVTGEAVWATFQQDTTRPVDGVPDPHLHTHSAVMNATFDAEEGRWKAAQIGNIAADRVYYEAVYLSELAHQMKSMGLGVERKGRWFDVAGLDKATLEKFSRRTEEIELEAAAAGGTLSPAQKAQLGKLTRARKTDEVAVEDLHGVWAARLDGRERALIDGLMKKAAIDGPGAPQKSVHEVWAYGLDNAFERGSVAYEKRVLEDALRYGYGDVRYTDVKAAASLEGVVRGRVNGRSVITTKDMLNVETRMIDVARKGVKACAPLGHGDYEISKPYLNDRQRAAIEHIWTSGDRVMMVEGDAGVGKTGGVVAEAVEGLKAAGRSVATFAPASGAVQALGEEVDAPAYTVAKYLVDTDLQKELRGAVLFVDEAGQVGVRDMAKILETVEANDNRLVLVGDTKQHGAVSAGDAMRLLQDRANLNTKRVTEIVRQKGEYKDAVAALSRGDLDEGWKRFEGMGAIIEMDGPARLDEVAKDYVGEVEADRSTLVVAPTHREKNAISTRIRSELKQAGRLGAREAEILQLRDTRWTEAERRDADRYEVGQVVKTFQNLPGVKNGERLTVVAKDDRGLPIVANRNGDERVLPLDRAQHFKVYNVATMPVAVGELVRVTEQGTDESGKSLRTGNVLTLKKFDREGRMVFDNGAVLKPDFGHLDHGYCSTSFASQGRTVDTVIASMGQQSAPAIFQEQFYVTASRGKSAVRIYTDDKEAAREAISRTATRASATELVEGAVDQNLQPTPRSERLKAYTSKVARHVAHLAQQRGTEIPIDKDLIREAKGVIAAEQAEHRGMQHDPGLDI